MAWSLAVEVEKQGEFALTKSLLGEKTQYKKGNYAAWQIECDRQHIRKRSAVWTSEYVASLSEGAMNMKDKNYGI